jgi:hypothetical protein
LGILPICYDVFMTKQVKVQVAAWLVSIAVVIVAVEAWGQSYGWLFGHLSLYMLFPLFGLLAFSLMWSHYLAAVVRLVTNTDKAVLKPYFEMTSLVALIAILLHPSLLIFQLFQDGRGLPPESYMKYVGPTLAWVTLLGSLSFFTFLAYELRRFYEDKPWWQYVQAATDVAMLAIFYHALRLGGALHLPWFRMIWFFYGITLVGALIYIYTEKFRARSSAR